MPDANPTVPEVGAQSISTSAEMSGLAASFARVRLLFSRRDIDSDSFNDDVRKSIGEALSRSRDPGGDAWIEIYEARRLNILLLKSDQLFQTVIGALQELIDDKVSAGPALQKAFDDLKAAAGSSPMAPATETQLRLVLLNMVEAIQWEKQKRYLTRQTTKEAAYRLVWCWAITFVLFISPYVTTVVAFYLAPKPATDTTLRITLEAWTAVVPWTVLAAGVMGALFSRLIYLQSNWTSLSLDQVEDAKQWSSILLRGSVGMCGAVIVFLFVRAGIVKSSLLPEFTEVGLSSITGSVKVLNGEDDMNLTLLAPTLAFSLLIIWCFLAGFSERFVPDILAATDKKLTAAAAK